MTSALAALVATTPSPPAAGTGGAAGTGRDGEFGRELERASAAGERADPAAGDDPPESTRPASRTDRHRAERASRRADAGAGDQPPIAADGDAAASTEATTHEGREPPACADATGEAQGIAQWMAALIEGRQGHDPAPAGRTSASAAADDALGERSPGRAVAGLHAQDRREPLAGPAPDPGHTLPRGGAADAAGSGLAAALDARAHRTDALQDQAAAAVAEAPLEGPVEATSRAALEASPVTTTASAPPPSGTQASGPRPAPEAALTPALNTPEFAPALGAQVVRFVRDGIEHARMRLNPAELGPVAVQLAVDGTQVRVDLVAEIAATRQVLEQGLPVLAGALRDAGFTLSGGGVFQQARDGGGGARDLPSGSPRDDALGSAERTSAPAATRARRAMGLVDTFV